MLVFALYCVFCCANSLFSYNFTDKLDQKIHMAAAKALQRIARIRSEEEKAD